MYNNCSELRGYFASWCHHKRVVLLRSTLTTVKALEQELFYGLQYGLYWIQREKIWSHPFYYKRAYLLLLNFLKDVSTANYVKLTTCDNFIEFLSISNEHSNASAGKYILLYMVASTSWSTVFITELLAHLEIYIYITKLFLEY